MKNEFLAEYWFTLSIENGLESIKIRRIKANTAVEALQIAKTIGLSEFGELFTKKCLDFYIVDEQNGLILERAYKYRNDLYYQK